MAGELLTREWLSQVPERYFEAIDAKDPEATMAFYSDDALETFLPTTDTFRGRDQIRKMYEDFFEATNDIKHVLTNVVVDVEQRKVSTEQIYYGDVKGSGKINRYNCNFFEFDAEGKVARVFIWRSDGNPPRY